MHPERIIIVKQFIQELADDLVGISPHDKQGYLVFYRAALKGAVQNGVLNLAQAAALSALVDVFAECLDASLFKEEK